MCYDDYGHLYDTIDSEAIGMCYVAADLDGARHRRSRRTHVQATRRSSGNQGARIEKVFSFELYTDNGGVIY